MRFTALSKPVAIIILFLTVLYLGVEHALSQMVITPPILRPWGAPGAVKSLEVFVANRSTQAMHCEMRAYNMTVNEIGRAEVGCGDDPRGCGSWLEFKPREFSLSPKEVKKITIIIRIPRGVSPGGYYALIACRAKPEEKKSHQESSRGVVSFGYELRSAVLLTVIGGHLDKRIIPGEPLMSVSGLRTSRNQAGWTLKLPITNKGNIHGIVFGQVDILTSAGIKLEGAKLRAGRGFILPQQTREFIARGDTNLPDGAYQARITLQIEGERRPIQNIFPFVFLDGKIFTGKEARQAVKVVREESAGFLLQPQKIRVALTPGAHRTQVVEITNMSEKTIQLVTEVKGWTQDQEGKTIILEEKQPNECISVKPETFSLHPRQKRRIPFMISLPEESEGEVFTSLVFTPLNLSEDIRERTLLERSVLVSVLAKGTEIYKAEISNFEVTRTSTGAHKFMVELENKGNSTCYAKGRISIYDKKGEEVDSLNIGSEDIIILPGSKRTLGAQWTKIVEPGDYRASVVLVFARDEKPLSAHLGFTVIPLLSGQG